MLVGDVANDVKEKLSRVWVGDANDVLSISIDLGLYPHGQETA